VFGAVTCTVGVPGALGGAGLIDAELAADGVLPAGPFAVTRNVYAAVVGFSPVKSQVSRTVAVQPSGGVATGLDVTE
jgi:hypothetical protein